MFALSDLRPRWQMLVLQISQRFAPVSLESVASAYGANETGSLVPSPK